jgi:4-hydroxybutyrate CoA-transferase
MLGQPSSLVMDTIAARKDELQDVEFINNLTFRPYKIFQPEYRKAFKVICMFYGTPVLMQFAKSEWANFMPGQSSDIGLKYAERNLDYPRRSVTVLQVTPPNNHGFVCLGLDTFYTAAVMRQSEVIIAEVNDQMPRTYGDTNFHVSQFAAFVEHSNPILAVPSIEPTEVQRKMAANVVSLIRDRDCLQVGIGGVPTVISNLLLESGLKDLGIHTEMLPTGTDKLVEKGVVTSKYKKVNPGKILLACTLGDKNQYDYIADNPMCEFRATEYANAIPVIASEDNVVAINGTIEVDLYGQICSESHGHLMRSGSGGQLDFAIGAFWSKGGRAINLVPSTAHKDTISRIVPQLSDGARVTVPRTYAQYVVTEHGVASLRGKTEPERAKALIKIAHPKFRDHLEESARKLGLIKKDAF